MQTLLVKSVKKSTYIINIPIIISILGGVWGGGGGGLGGGGGGGGGGLGGGGGGVVLQTYWALSKELGLRRKNAFCLLHQWAPCYHHAPVAMMLSSNSTLCWTTETVSTQHLVMVNSSAASHAAIGMI